MIRMIRLPHLGTRIAAVPETQLETIQHLRAALSRKERSCSRLAVAAAVGWVLVVALAISSLVGFLVTTDEGVSAQVTVEQEAR